MREGYTPFGTSICRCIVYNLPPERRFIVAIQLKEKQKAGFRFSNLEKKIIFFRMNVLNNLLLIS